MSLKGIELQIAIPKTFDAGKIAEQKQQQSQLNQDLANALTETANGEKQGNCLGDGRSMRKRMEMATNVEQDELTGWRTASKMKRKRRRCILIKVHLLTLQGNR